MRKLSRLISIVLNGLLVFLLCSNVYLIAVKQFGRNPQPQIFGYSSAVVISGSMSGCIEVNDMVIVHRQEEYAAGDVISFTSGNNVVTHRIVDITEEGFTTKGDANNTIDQEPVPLSHVLGQVVLVIPGIGKWIQAMQTPLGMTCIVLTGIGLIELPAFLDRRNNSLAEKKGDEYENEGK